MDRTFVLIGLGRPNCTGKKSFDGNNFFEPKHGFKRFHSLFPCFFVACSGIFVGHCCQVGGGVSAVVITYFTDPLTVLVKQGMDKTKPLVPPFIKMALKIIRLFCQRVRLVTDNPQSFVRSNVHYAVTSAYVVHMVSGKPQVGPEILKITIHHPYCTPGGSNPDIICKSFFKTGNILHRQSLFSLQSGEGRSAQYCQTPVGSY